MSGARSMFVALLVGTSGGLVACAYANGYDPSRYATPAPSASVDPEIEPLTPSPKRRMRDPRGVAIVDAGAVIVASSAVVDASVDHVAIAVTCGSKADPCPMQGFMRSTLATAHTPDTLTSAFTHVAGMSPDPAWAWVAIATRGAERANAGDLQAAKAQCVACHDAYRSEYRARFRARAL